jgi:hypothetical protein
LGPARCHACHRMTPPGAADSRGGRGRIGSRLCWASVRAVSAQKRPHRVERLAVARTTQAVIPDRDPRVRKPRRPKPAAAFLSPESAELGVLGVGIVVLEGDLTSCPCQEAVMADGHANDVGRERLERVSAWANWLAMDHPVLCPNRCGDAVKPGGLSQRRAAVGTQHDREGLHRDQASGPGGQPWLVLAGKPAGGHQGGHMGMVVQGSGPRVQHPDQPDRAADNPGIAGELVEGRGCRAEAGVVEALVVAAGQCPPRRGYGTGHQAIRDRQAHLLWPWQPRLGRAVLACGTVAVCAGLRALLGVVAVCTARDMTAQRCGPAWFDRLHGVPMAGPQLVLACGPRRRALPAEERCEVDQHRAAMRRLRATPASSGAGRVRGV